MDASEERNSKAGLFDRILPPRIEDAGLEDAALPPDSIAEAFFKAAEAVKSRVSAFIYSDDDSDSDDDDSGGFSVEEQLRLPALGLDEAVVGEEEEERGRGKGSVLDVLGGLEIEEKAAWRWKKKKICEEEKPIFAKDFA